MSFNQQLDPVDQFIAAAVWHGSLDAAEAILAAHPDIATRNIHTAAILGDADLVAHFIAADASSAVTPGGPGGWPPLLHLCLSKYLRLDPSRSEGLLRSAKGLLDAGADPNGGVTINDEFEAPLYGAAGVAAHPAMTRLLVERGADINDVEVAYHSPETYNTEAMQVLLDTGRMSASNLSMMLVRKADWHDYAGMKLLLDHGADASGDDTRPWRPLHHAIRRNNQIEMITLLVDHGADASLTDKVDQKSAIALAAWHGRADVLSLLSSRGVEVAMKGVERLISACGRDDQNEIQQVSREQPELVTELLAHGSALLGKFSGCGNLAGLRNLLDLGIPVDARWPGDGYFGIPPMSTALHVAAWRGWPALVSLLISRGADVQATDGHGTTPLALAVRATVDSYWMIRRSPDSVRALLDAGARIDGVAIPCGYTEVDELLERLVHGSESRIAALINPTIL